MTLTFTYYGHSALAIDADGIKLLVDPFLAPNNPLAPVSADEVDADFILITHGHEDHMADAAAVAKRTGAEVIANFEVMRWLVEQQGVTFGHGMNTGGAHTFPFGRLKLTVAHHSSSMPDGSDGGNPYGMLITFNDGHDVYLAGDTALTYDMKLIGERGGVDLAFLPIGDYYTMGPDDAELAAQFVKAKHVVPIHHSTFPEIEQDTAAFATALQQSAEIDCTVLQPGESLTLG